MPEYRLSTCWKQYYCFHIFPKLSRNSRAMKVRLLWPDAHKRKHRLLTWETEILSTIHKSKLILRKEHFETNVVVKSAENVCLSTVKLHGKWDIPSDETKTIRVTKNLCLHVFSPTLDAYDTLTLPTWKRSWCLRYNGTKDIKMYTKKRFRIKKRLEI